MIEPEQRILLSVFECSNDKCRQKIKIAQTLNEFSEPKICSKCKSSGSWEILVEESVFIEVQRIRIQEFSGKNFEKNPDILESISKSNVRPKIVIGFSAETTNINQNAHSKLMSKNIDLIIANDVSNNKVFGEDFNKVSLIEKNNYEEWKKQSKKSVAYHLANKINDLLINYNKRGVNA